ncbi:MAG: chorismate-binding protein [Planctomycetota bacterium]
MHANLDKQGFCDVVRRARAGEGVPKGGGPLLVTVGVRLLADQLTPVLAYRRLVHADERTDPSFLFESVEGGERVGRHSIMGAQPVVEVIAHKNRVRLLDRRRGHEHLEEREVQDPFAIPRELTNELRLVPREMCNASALPACFTGGWTGFASYDTVRFAEPGKLPWAGAPRDDRELPDLHMAMYDRVVVFDHVDKVVHVVVTAEVGAADDAAERYESAMALIARTVRAIESHTTPLPAGVLERSERGALVANMPASNMTRETHAEMVERAKSYIRAGDIFQVVLGQRFEKVSRADPFDVYRALRAVNPSPYMVYMQGSGTILVASSPEILCRVSREADGSMRVTNRPLAGTRRRGDSEEEDKALERDLLDDAKERAEHIMLVDLGRNDVGKVADPASVRLDAAFEIERYSHVMHISSTVTGVLHEGLDAWDALRAALPVGTISGAPKVRAMQIIDELEPIRRGPYGGGMGAIGFDGQMDVALALRTIVVPASRHDGTNWTYHVQSAGGIVFDSDAGAEYDETVNKAAAMVEAIVCAERAFAARD